MRSQNIELKQVYFGSSYIGFTTAPHPRTRGQLLTALARGIKINVRNRQGKSKRTCLQPSESWCSVDGRSVASICGSAIASICDSTVAPVGADGSGVGSGCCVGLDGSGIGLDRSRVGRLGLHMLDYLLCVDGSGHLNMPDDFLNVRHVDDPLDCLNNCARNLYDLLHGLEPRHVPDDFLNLGNWHINMPDHLLGAHHFLDPLNCLNNWAWNMDDPLHGLDPRHMPHDLLNLGHRDVNLPHDFLNVGHLNDPSPQSRPSAHASRPLESG